MTLGQSDWSIECLTKGSQLGWLGDLIKISPLWQVELGIERMMDYRGSCKRIMSK